MSVRFHIVLLILVLATRSISAQESPYRFALRGVPLDQALEHFAETTGLALSYDPLRVEDQQAYCVIESPSAEAVLSCVLRGTRLDYYRLSSGIYVIAETLELPQVKGYVIGRVTDDATGQPIADAHVWLADAGIGTVSDRQGQFVLPALLPGRYAVQVSHLGYGGWTDTLQVEAGVRTEARALLRNTAVQVRPVVIDGLQDRWSSELLGEGQVRVPEETQGQPVLQVLQALPGLRINDATADLHVQGGAAGEHQFRLDGVPVFLPQQSIGFVGPFSAFALDRVTLHKTGFGAQHGSQISGVIAAEHSLETVNGADVQFDPVGLNARVQLHRDGGAYRSLSGMVAARFGPWGLRAAPQLQDLLDRWSRPDPFLVFAPVTIYPRLDTELGDVANAAEERAFISDTFSEVGAPGRPELDFSDLHVAGRMRFGLLRTVSASFYQGRNRLQGGLAGAQENLQVEQHDAAVPPPVTVFDGYDWVNRLGQVSFDAVLGGRTLMKVQGRGSHYRLNHEYLLVDSLALTFNQETALDFRETTEINDGNRMQEWAAEVTIDHARDRHHLHLGLEAALTRSRFNLLMVTIPADRNASQTQASGFSVNRGRIEHDTNRSRLTMFGTDRIALGRHTVVDAGLRLSYINATLYAEPRLALRYDGAIGTQGSWGMRTSMGLYRQFVTQHDLSALNAGALLPSVRIWLPVGETVRPPMALHLAQAFLIRPQPAFTFRGEAYIKYQPHNLTLNYALDEAALSATLIAQQDFLTPIEGQAWGASVSAAYARSAAEAELEYTFSRARQRSDALFDGNAQTTPWNEPHRLELDLRWRPFTHWMLTSRWQGVWGRSWGFRRAYYDYFGHNPRTRSHPPFDLGNPQDDVLPAFYQLDLGVAYTRRVGPFIAEGRVEVLNLLDRRNVLDWRILTEGDQLRLDPRYLYGRLPVFALRLGW